MPIYTFKNKNTEEISEKLMTYSSREEFLRENPDLELIPGAAAVGDPVRMGMMKPDSGFRDVLQRVKDKHYKSTVNTWK